MDAHWPGGAPGRSSSPKSSRCAVDGIARFQAAGARDRDAGHADGGRSGDTLPEFVDLAMKLTGARPRAQHFDPSRGEACSNGVPARLAAGVRGATTPRNYSPCGITLDRRQPVAVPSLPSGPIPGSRTRTSKSRKCFVPLAIALASRLARFGSWPMGGRFTRDHARLLADLALSVAGAARIGAVRSPPAPPPRRPRWPSRSTPATAPLRPGEHALEPVALRPFHCARYRGVEVAVRRRKGT